MCYPSRSKPSPPQSNRRRRSNNKRSCRGRKTRDLLSSDQSLTDYLPSDLLVEVLSHVASNSVADLLSFKQTCKLLSESASERHVIQNAAVLDMYSFNKRSELDDQNSYARFIAQCVASDNLEALFCRGIEDYFSRGEGAMSNLRAVAERGLKAAKYACGIIGLLTEKEEGLGFLSGLRKAGDLGKCREAVKYVVRRNMWVKNVDRNHPMFRGLGRDVVGGGRCGCDRRVGRGFGSFSKDPDFEWRTMEEQVVQVVDSGLCDSCFWEFEASVFRKCF